MFPSSRCVFLELSRKIQQHTLQYRLVQERLGEASSNDSRLSSGLGHDVQSLALRMSASVLGARSFERPLQTNVCELRAWDSRGFI